MSARTNSRQAIEQLAQKLSRLEKNGRRFQGPVERHSTGLVPLDNLLPEGGICPGTLMEWLSDGPGSGAGTLAFRIAAHLTGDNRTCIAIDPERSLYPPAIYARERFTGQLVVVHPANERDTLWVMEQSLRCCGVAAIVCRTGSLPGRTYRRLQLAVETGGGFGLLLRPGKFRSEPSWADVRLQVTPIPRGAISGANPVSGTDAFPEGRLLRMELIHSRGRAGGSTVELEMDDDTGDVRLAPRLAATANPFRIAGA